MVSLQKSKLPYICSAYRTKCYKNYALNVKLLYSQTNRIHSATYACLKWQPARDFRNEMPPTGFKLFELIKLDFVMPHLGP